MEKTVAQRVHEALAECERNGNQDVRVLTGNFQLLGEFGFARSCTNIHSSTRIRRDVFIAKSQVERFKLSDSESITVLARPPKKNERGSSWCALKILQCRSMDSQSNSGPASSRVVEASMENKLGTFLQSTSSKLAVRDALASCVDSSDGNLVLAGVFDQVQNESCASACLGFGRDCRRVGSFSPSRRQVFFSPSQVERFQLTTGDLVTVLARHPKGHETAFGVIKVLDVDIGWKSSTEQLHDDACTAASGHCNKHASGIASAVEDTGSQVDPPLLTPSVPYISDDVPVAPPPRDRVYDWLTNLESRVQQLERELAVLIPPTGLLPQPFTVIAIDNYRCKSDGYLSFLSSTELVVLHVESSGTHSIENELIGDSVVWFYGREANVCGENPKFGWFPARYVRRPIH